MVKGHAILAHGRMINKMVKGSKYGLRGPNMQASMQMKRNRARGGTYGPMGPSSTGCGTTTKLTGRDSFNGKMGRNIMANG